MRYQLPPAAVASLPANLRSVTGEGRILLQIRLHHLTIKIVDGWRGLQTGSNWMIGIETVEMEFHVRKPMELGETNAEIQGGFASNPMTPIETSWYFLPPKRGLGERFDAAKVLELGR